MKFNDWTELSLFAAVLLSCYLFAEQLVIAVMAVSKNAYNTSVFCIYVIMVTIMLGSGMLRYVSNLRAIPITNVPFETRATQRFVREKV